MRDFLPSDVRKREYVIGIIKKVYESYGFEPLETPAVENIETLTGKYGEEGNQLIYKILKRGEKLDANAGEKDLADLALRYDLTVPLARVVANHKNDLPRFFKRYQIQPVWRADRPARGRYREFYQCDVDAIGSDSMVVEAELCAAVSEILERLGFNDFVIRINHREILREILNASGVSEEKYSEILVSIDKLDKIGHEGVLREFSEKGLEEETGNKVISAFSKPNPYLQDSFKVKGSSFKNLRSLEKLAAFIGNKKTESLEKDPINVWQDAIIEAYPSDVQNHKRYKEDILNWLIELTGNNENGTKAIEELYEFYQFSWEISAGTYIEFDPSLARGLSYYTGVIFEINVPDLSGSLGGGGRYDGLIGMFGKEQIPACGFSLGLERILVVMEERGMFPKELSENSADVLVTIWNEETIGESLKLAAELRKENLRVLVYPETDKLGKQFKYAGQINVPFVCVLGETELAENKVTLKNMLTSEQDIISREDIASKIKKLLS